MPADAPKELRSPAYGRAQRIMLVGSLAVLAIAAPLLIVAKLNGTLPAHFTWTKLAIVLPCVLLMNAIFWLPRRSARAPPRRSAPPPGARPGISSRRRA